MRFLTEKQFRAIHEGHALKVHYLELDLTIARSERNYYMEARERVNDLRIFAVNERDAYRLERNAARAERETLRNERDEEKKFRVAFRAEAVTFRNERDKARAEVEKLNRMHAKAAECRAEIDKMKAAYSAKSDEALKERDEARAELDKLKAAYSVRPMGLGEMLAAEFDRASKISADYNAKQADAALDSFVPFESGPVEDKKPWEPSDCIVAESGCFCNSELG